MQNCLYLYKWRSHSTYEISDDITLVFGFLLLQYLHIYCGNQEFSFNDKPPLSTTYRHSIHTVFLRFLSSLVQFYWEERGRSTLSRMSSAKRKFPNPIIYQPIRFHSYSNKCVQTTTSWNVDETTMAFARCPECLK